MSSERSPAAGMLLIAPPILEDPNFRRSVVLLCEHTPEGSFGLILNRPLAVRLADVMEGVGSSDFPLQQGGPVQTDTLHFLHSRGEDIPDAIPVTEGIYWGGDFEALRILIDTAEVSSSEVRLFLGYAGWSPDQLEFEIEQGGWILSELAESVVFDADPSDLWRRTLRRMGGEYAVLANYPEDPRLN